MVSADVLRVHALGDEAARRSDVAGRGECSRGSPARLSTGSSVCWTKSFGLEVAAALAGEHAAVRRGELPSAEQIHEPRREVHHAERALRLGRGDPVRRPDASHVELPPAEIHVVPLQRHQLADPESREEQPSTQPRSRRDRTSGAWRASSRWFNCSGSRSVSGHRAVGVGFSSSAAGLRCDVLPLDGHLEEALEDRTIAVPHTTSARGPRRATPPGAGRAAPRRSGQAGTPPAWGRRAGAPCSCS